MSEQPLTKTHIWFECGEHGTVRFFEESDRFVCGHPSTCYQFILTDEVVKHGVPITRRAGEDTTQIFVDTDLFGVEHIKRAQKGKRYR